MHSLILITAAAGVATFSYSLLSFLVSEERQVKRQLKRLDAYETQDAFGAEPALVPFRQRVIAPALEAVAHVVRLFTPSDYAERLRKRLVLAGSPAGLSPERYVGGKVVLMAACATIAVAFTVSLSSSVPRTVLAAFVATAAAFFVPDLWLGQRIESRKLAIRKAMPDTLDMLTISVEAGMGFDAAVTRVVSGRPGPLSEEFGRTLQEVQAGVSRREALRRMAARTEVPELNSFIMAIIQADVFGVSVSNVLRTQSREMRVKRRQLAEELAQKAPVKIVFPLVLCILPATLIVIGGPAMIGIGRAFGMVD